MKNMLRKLIAATAICALCAVTALPASAADGTALTLDQFVSLARLVFNQADPADAIAKMDSVVSKTVEKTGSVDEIAAALAAAVVAREDADSEPLFEGIVAAAGDDAERAAATLLAVTSSTGTMPSLEGDVSLLSEEETAALTELYKKVLAALRPGKYAMKEDRDGVGAGLGTTPATDGNGDQTGTAGADGTAGGTAAGADGTDAGTTAGADGTDAGTTAGADGTDAGTTTTDGGTPEGTGDGTTDGGTPEGTGDGTSDSGTPEGTGDDTSDTTNPIDILDNDPYELHTTPTTLSGSGIYVPGIHSPTTTTTVPTKPSKPTKPTKPVKPVTPTTSPSPTPTGIR